MNRDQKLAAWLEGDLDSAGRQELLQDLSSDESFARDAVAQLQVKRLLGSQAIDENEFTRELLLKVESIPGNDIATDRAVMERLKRHRRWQRSIVAAAGLAAALVIVALLVFRLGSPGSSYVRVLAAEGVQSLDVRALEAGQLVIINSGILELALGEHSRLVLEAPAAFAVESAKVVRFVRGRCYAEMDKGTSGLIIKTPEGDVLDLGTRFGVEVTPAQGTAVHVFEGEVELTLAENRKVLRRGEGARWKKGAGARPIAVEPERFISRLPGSKQQPAKWLHWSFDEGSGDTASPRGEGFSSAMGAARLHGARWIARDGSGALAFDGVDDWVETTFVGIGEDADRTVAAWVKLAPDFGIRNGQAIVGWGDFNARDPNRQFGAAWELCINDHIKQPDLFGRLKVAVGGPLTVGHNDLRDETWHHVAAVYLSEEVANGRGVVLLYVDAQLQQRTFGRNAVKLNTELETSSSEPVQFGRQVIRGASEREYFKGAIDEVFIIDRALSGEEIRALMRSNIVP